MSSALLRFLGAEGPCHPIEILLVRFSWQHFSTNTVLLRDVFQITQTEYFLEYITELVECIWLSVYCTLFSCVLLGYALGSMTVLQFRNFRKTKTFLERYKIKDI